MPSYNTGDVVRQWQTLLVGTEPNLAFPEMLMAAWVVLDELTQEIEAANVERGAPDDQITRDLNRWLERSTFYFLALAVPDELMRSRTVTLWTVTAPLLLGWYGGEAENPPLPPSSMRQGFNPQIPHAADIITPYTLANQLGVYAKAGAAARSLIRKDVQETVKAVGSGVAQVVVIAARASMNTVTGGALGGALGDVVAGAAGELADAAGDAAKKAIPWWVWVVLLGAGAWWLKPTPAAAGVL